MPIPISIPITKFRNKLADYLELVELERATILVRNEKRDKEVARVLPVKEEKSTKDLEAVIRKTFGMWHNFPEKEILANSPLRGRKSKAWLEEARKQKIF